MANSQPQNGVGPRGNIVYLPVEDLHPETARYQRPLDTKRADTIAAEFMLGSLSVITVSHRDDDLYWVVDGQHRRHALRVLNWKEPIPVMVFHGIDLPTEARLYRELNDLRRLMPVWDFTAGYLAGDVRETHMENFANSLGWAIAKIPENERIGHLSAVREWMDAYDTKPSVFDNTLRALTRAGFTPREMQSTIVGGVAMAVRRGASADLPRLAKQLEKLGADEILSDAAKLAKLHSTGGQKGAVYDILRANYNRGKPAKKLPGRREANE